MIKSTLILSQRVSISQYRKGDSEMSWSLYDLLEYGTRTKCDECGISLIVQGIPETPCLCKRCSRKRYKPTTTTKEPSVGRGRKSALTAEEKAERRKQANRKYQETHREHANQYVRNRKAEDPVFRLKSQTRNAIYQSFARTGNVKSARCEKIVGLPIDDFVFSRLATLLPSSIGRA